MKAKRLNERVKYRLAISRSLLLCTALSLSLWASPVRAGVSSPDKTNDGAVFVGAGDIADCSGSPNPPKSTDTAALINDILAANITATVFTLGDNAYASGTTEEYEGCYGTTWGQFKAQTMPVPGNHEYYTTGAAGYYGYFLDAASPQQTGCVVDCLGYYSYEVGDWHIIALNSEFTHTAESAQITWLKSDLETHKASACTLAYWHKPLFTSGYHQSDGDILTHKTFWDVLYQYGVDVILNGHDHEYERFAPQNPDGQPDSAGIREFVVGTGGSLEIRPFKTMLPTSEVTSTAYGVLKLNLLPNGYEWNFISTDNSTVVDTGTGNCVTQTPSSTPVFVGAGDIADCSAAPNPVKAAATAELIKNLPAAKVFTLGDNAYAAGTPAEFFGCYEQTWGPFKGRTSPVPGNHDYATSGAAGYYEYFGSLASPDQTGCVIDCLGYYSYDLGSWHIIALNSEKDHTAESAQITWLKNDLETHKSSVCTLAYWHKPLFTSGGHQTDGDRLNHKVFWDVLYQYGVDIVLNGHDHEYERFALQNPDGQPDSAGIREFVVGTGGTSLRQFATIQPNSEVRDNVTFGVLKLQLDTTSYTWAFLPIAGQTFNDVGTGACVSPKILNNRVYMPILTS